MRFRVPDPMGKGWLTPEEAEEAWQVCRKGAEGQMGRDALARRVCALAFVHDGDELSTTVGQRDGYNTREVVMAIIAFPGVYLICSTVHGYLKVGGTPMVGEGAVRWVKDFDDEQ